MRKRIIKTAALILSLVMLLSMASCSNGRIKDYAVAHETEFGAVIIDISTELNPAIIRSRVVLPQPEGPSRVKSSPGCMSAVSLRMTILSSYFFMTSLI